MEVKYRNLDRTTHKHHVDLLPSKMAHMNKQLFTRSPLDGSRPANKVWTEPEEDKNLAVSLGSGLEPAVYAPSVGTSRTQRGGGRRDAVYCCSIGLGEVSACRPIFGPAHLDLLREIGLEGWRFADVDGPQCTANGEKILRIGNFLMPEKLSPGAVGGIAEIVGQFAGGIPSASGLR